MKKTVLAAVAAATLAVVGVGGAALAAAGDDGQPRAGLGAAAPAATDAVPTAAGTPSAGDDRGFDDDRFDDRGGRDGRGGDDRGRRSDDDGGGRDDDGRLDDRGDGGRAATPAPAGAAALTAEQAASLAVGRVGGGTVTEVEREWEHGRLEWKVEIHAGSVEYDVRVDAHTGQITRFERDND